MAEVTVKQLASVVGTPVERLLEQIKDAGLDIDTPDSLISDSDKMTLLGFLRSQHGKDSNVDSASKPHKIALKRKSVSEVKVGAAGKKTVSIEVRRKRTIARPAEQPAESETEISQETPSEITELEKLRADQARREQERDDERRLKRERAEKREQDLQSEESRLAESKAKAETQTALKTGQDEKAGAEKAAAKEHQAQRKSAYSG